MKKKMKPLMIIGVILIILNCISLISNPSIISDVLRYTGNILSLIGVFWPILIGLIFVLIYAVSNRER